MADGHTTHPTSPAKHHHCSSCPPPPSSCCHAAVGSPSDTMNSSSSSSSNNNNNNHVVPSQHLPHQQQQQQQHNHPQPIQQPQAQAYVAAYSTSAVAETYRASAPAMSTAPLLPPIQHFDGQSTMSSQPPYAAAAAVFPPHHYHPYPNGVLAGAQMPPPMNGQHNGAVMRYALPPQTPLDARQMAGARHKKEIKRRTKTGCLTCRKRRIKCDEGAPTCRNCQKSKRECLGYDPIFKPQSGPANIQPAPIALGDNDHNPHHHHNPLPPNPHAPPPTVPSNHPYPAPHFPATGGIFVPTRPEQQSHEYTTSLDPVLASGNPALHMAHDNYPPVLQPQRKVRPVMIEELFSIDDIPPRYIMREAPPSASPATHQDADSFYKFHYAPGLDRLLETTWYSTRGSTCLQRDPSLLDFVAQVSEQFKSRASDDSMSKPLKSLETRLVWLLAAMPRNAAHQANGAGSDSPLQELLPRIDTLEKLLTGQFLHPQAVPPPPSQQSVSQPSLEEHNKYNERAFWYHLARFVSLRDDNPAALQEVNDALVGVRGVLNMLENRDVIYSIAVARHVGGRMPEFHPQRHLVASSNDPNDDLNKLKVAHQFVEGEDQRGTTQPIQRICSMAIRGWILQKQ